MERRGPSAKCKVQSAKCGAVWVLGFWVLVLELASGVTCSEPARDATPGSRLVTSNECPANCPDATGVESRKTEDVPGLEASGNGARAARLLGFAKGKPNLIEQAYVDAYQILTSENRCGTFFGGRRSVVALNRLVPQMRAAALEPYSLIRMSGYFMQYADAETGLRYRLFERVTINIDGAFYRPTSAPGQVHVMPLGGLPPGSREARVAGVIARAGTPDRRRQGRLAVA